MNLEEKHIELFENYANGNMDIEAQENFEKLLREDEALRKEYYIFSDIFDDINTFAEKELKKELNDIHIEFNSNYTNKENWIKKLYYFLGFLFFMLILFVVYLMGGNQAKKQIKNKTKAEIQQDSILIKIDAPEQEITIQVASKKDNNESKELLEQQIQIIEQVMPTPSYSFNESKLKLYGLKETDLKNSSLLKDDDKYYLYYNEHYFLITNTGGKTNYLSQTNYINNSIINEEPISSVETSIYSTLDTLTEQIQSIIFDTKLKENQISLKNDKIILSEKHAPLKKLKKVNDTIFITSSRGKYFFNPYTSDKLQVLLNSEKKPLRLEIPLYDSFLENDYLNNNNF